MADLLRISETAQTILDTVNNVFTQNGVPLPTRQYLALGEVGKTVHDDEQVTVSFGSVSEGLPYNNIPVLQKCGEPYRSTFTVEIVRCTPTPKATSGGLKEVAPTAAEISAYSTTRMTDAWLLVIAAQEFGKTTILETAVYDVIVGDDLGGMQGVFLSLNTVV